MLRYLGVMIGNTVPKDTAWHRIKSKVADTIMRNRNIRPTLTERTLTANSVITGNMLYGVAHSHIHEKTLIKMDKVVQNAVTDGNSMIPIDSLTADRKHGTSVSYIPPLKLFRGLQASPMHDIINGHSNETYKYNWIHSAATVAHKLGFKTLTHLLRSSKKATQLRPSTKSKYQPEVRQSIIALQDIGLQPTNPITNWLGSIHGDFVWRII